MILDNLLFFSGAVSATGVLTGQAANGAGNVLSTNTIDIAPLSLGGNQPGEFGAGESIKVEFSVLTAPTVGTTVKFQLVQADDPALATNLQVLSSTDDIAIALLPAGTLVPLKWNQTEPLPLKRYMGVRYVNTGAIATFSVVSAVVKDAQSIKNLYFKSGYSVS